MLVSLDPAKGKRAYFWRILHPCLFANVGEAFGQDDNFVARDVVLFEGFADNFFAYAVRVDVCYVPVSFGRQVAFLGRIDAQLRAGTEDGV
jgi:hypothetical protein